MTRTSSLAAALAAALLAASCTPRPVPVTVVPSPPPTPAPTTAPTPPPSVRTAFPDVPEPRLDVGVAVDRAAFRLPAGEWLLRSGGEVRRVVGALEARPAASEADAAPRFQVQAGSFTARVTAEAEAVRLAALLGLPAAVAEGGGRFAVRLGPPGDRASLDPLLYRVRRDAVPEAFLVGLADPGRPDRTLLVDVPGGRLEVPSPVELAAADATLLPVNGAPYRGTLLLVATPRGTLHVVNRVGLEEYLLGVVPLEMGPRVYDELEALKAQAVAARTYAVKRRGDFAAEGYDLCATARCQVYGGASAEQPLSSEAVRATAGQVLLWNGVPADTLFTSTCGGRTEDAVVVFPSYAPAAFPYLRSVACRGEERIAFSSTSPVAGHDFGALAVRGAALLHAAGRRGASWTDLKVARGLLTDRLGLPAGAPPATLAPEAVYANLSGVLGDPRLLTEVAERDAAPKRWGEPARTVHTALSRFQLAGPTPLPTHRSFTPHEAAGLWASLLLRAGGLEELEGRLVGAPRGKVVLKTSKGREERTLPPDALLFRGGGEAWTPASSLDVAPGDRVRLLSRDGKVLAVLAQVPAVDGLFERESAWIHWVRRFTGAELMRKLLERDASRMGSVVRRVDVLARGVSGRAAKVRVTTDRESFDLSGLEIRFALALPESLFTHVTGKDGSGAPVHTFYGRGWGHGVGLCQNGTFGMALAGRTHAEILAAYYPGTALGAWPPPPEPERPGSPEARPATGGEPPPAR
ncbi:MAG TPA: SpoIID/LytB domain-containing protein [Thermoanaerobaculia bacterium]|nr:SpoIID/LytB domain-containing protein [Thermoanaerobaculia bacterium]HPA50671.1 SpoIID/LytB domain-containing protein [Thermoanaerobaculia bacterium]HQN07149.1 SpoIID/LytB domain-containing protein [Thermoanaerobaculia bacterium]HQP85696.1 SpoIID/LytB domain-containing protein [Thermoanaerobaculia bacterium]